MNVVNRTLYYLIRLFRYLSDGIYNKITLAINGVKYNRVAIRGKIFCKVSPGGFFEIGDKCRVNSGTWVNVIGGDTRTNFVVQSKATLRIGNNVGISNSTFVAKESICIEDDVLIGGGCKFYDNDFHSLNIKQRLQLGEDNIKTAAILVKKGAFIGAHSIILKGVTIGENAIIGAGSVVAKSVPNNEIWAGNPASCRGLVE